MLHKSCKNLRRKKQGLQSKKRKKENLSKADWSGTGGEISESQSPQKDSYQRKEIRRLLWKEMKG